jgi:hypothetical protein
VVRGASAEAPVDNSEGQLEAAAAGAELVELELSDELELDFSDDDFSDGEEEVVDSDVLAEPLDELLAEVFDVSRLSLR